MIGAKGVANLDEKDKELDQLIYDTYGIVEPESDEPRPAPRKPRHRRKIIYTSIILLLVFGSVGSSFEPIMSAINYSSQRRQLNNLTIKQAETGNEKLLRNGGFGPTSDSLGMYTGKNGELTVAIVQSDFQTTTPNIQRALKGAIKFWRVKSHGKINIKEVQQRQSPDVLVRAGAMGDEGTDAGTHALAWMNPSTGELRVSGDVLSLSNQNTLTKTLAHELGHALGLGHTTDGHNIMSAMLSPKADDVSTNQLTHIETFQTER